MGRPSILFMVFFVTTAFTQPPAEEYLLLGGPEGYVREFGESCPVRLQLPLDALFKKNLRGHMVTDKAAGATCNGAYIAKLTLKRDRGRWVDRTKRVFGTQGQHILVEPQIFVGPGVEDLLELKLDLLHGGTQIATTSQKVDATELRRWSTVRKAHPLDSVSSTTRDPTLVDPVQPMGLSFDPVKLPEGEDKFFLRITMSLSRFSG